MDTERRGFSPTFWFLAWRNKPGVNAKQKKKGQSINLPLYTIPPISHLFHTWLAGEKNRTGKSRTTDWIWILHQVSLSCSVPKEKQSIFWYFWSNFWNMCTKRIYSCRWLNYQLTSNIGTYNFLTVSLTKFLGQYYINIEIEENKH